VNVVLYVCLYCGQKVAWIKVPVGTEAWLGRGDIALDGDPATPRKGAQHPPPTFRPMCIVAKRSPTPQLLSSC